MTPLPHDLRGYIETETREQSRFMKDTSTSTTWLIIAAAGLTAWSALSAPSPLSIVAAATTVAAATVATIATVKTR